MILDYRQSPEYQEILRQSFGALAKDLGAGQVGYLVPIKVLPFFSVMIIQRVHDVVALSRADQLARQHRSLVIEISPKVPVEDASAPLWEAELRRYGYRKTKVPAVPTKTILLDLGLSDDELLAAMKPKKRYNIRLAQKRGLSTRVIDGNELLADSQAWDEFYRIYAENCKRIKLPSLPREFLEASARSYGAQFYAVHAYQPSGAAGAVLALLVAGDTAYYTFNGSTEEGRHDQAPNLAAWEAILEARRRGCRWFDFDGIVDERYTAGKEWEGFSDFKAGFGGREVTFLGSFRKWVPFLRPRVRGSPLA